MQLRKLKKEKKLMKTKSKKKK